MKQSVLNSDCAIASDNLQIEETGTEVIVFDSKAQLFHLLNATASSILKACNGSNTIKDIAAMLSAKFNSEDLDAVINDVTETITQFHNKGLVMFVVDDLQLRKTASDSLTENSLLAVSVTGTSMFPILLSGDKVLVKRSSIEDLNAGDIIVWSDESLKLVAHRILSMEVTSTQPLITTKGDLRVEPDPPVEIDRVLGKIVAVLREGGVQWIRELDGNNKSSSNKNEGGSQRTDQSINTSHLKQKPSYKRMQVLDLQEISVESIRNIESVEQIGLILLSPENAHAWPDVLTRDVKAVFTVPEGYRVYTGQPELLPELLEFIQTPLRLVVSGQLFLTAFEPYQILEAFNELILNGQAYVSSVESKMALESVTRMVSGEICVVPNKHIRWIGSSILGPEYLSNYHHQPLVVVGELTISQRMDSIPDNISLFNNSVVMKK
jgi:signal peptidase I